MTNFPPQPGGWIDGSGHLNPSTPPQGYWQASDGRWYPPDLSSSATQAVGGSGQFSPPSPGGPPPGPGPYGAPQQFGGYGGPQGPQPYQAPNQGSSGSRNGLIIALGALTAVVVLGVVAAVALKGNDDTTDSTIALPEVTTLGGDGSGGTAADTGSTIAGDASGGTGGGPGIVVAPGQTCAYLDTDYLQIDVTNDTGSVLDYYLTIILRDDAGNRVGDTTQYIESLRPGERAVMPVINYENESGGTQCEVAESETYEVDAAETEAAAASSCQLTGESSFSNNPEGTVNLVNSGGSSVDMYADIAIMDANGVRVDATVASASAVAAGESAPADVSTYGPVLYDPSLTCEVVSVVGY